LKASTLATRPSEKQKASQGEKKRKTEKHPGLRVGLGGEGVKKVTNEDYKEPGQGGKKTGEFFQREGEKVTGTLKLHSLQKMGVKKKRENISMVKKEN